MTETVVVHEELVEETNPVLEMVHKAFQAGLGVFAVAQDRFVVAQEKFAEITDDAQGRFNEFTDRLVKQGAELEKGGREAFNELVTSRRKQVKESVEETQTNFERRVEETLHGLNIPTRSDIEELNKKVAALTRKVNALSKDLKES
ncbi:MAG: phasin family protein [Anaerolineales bacterium]|nr:phasin family protein [Anaerolineales bacterium]